MVASVAADRPAPARAAGPRTAARDPASPAPAEGRVGQAPAERRGGPAATRLIDAAAGALRFEVEVPEPRLQPLAEDPAVSALSIDGYQETGAAGSPALPARVVMVAIPPAGEVSLHGMSLEAATLDAVDLAPVPALERGPEGVTARYRRTPEAYATRAAGVGDRVKLVGIGWLRNQRVARIAIQPADYDPAARRLVLARRIQVEVVFSPAAPVTTPAESPDAFERVYRTLLVNYEQGKNWRRAAGDRFGRPAPGTLHGRAGTAEGFGATAVAAGDTVYAGRQWIKLAVSRPGIYKVDYGTLRNLRPITGATVATADLRLFTWRSPLPVLPEGDYCDTCAYGEVPIGTEDGGDGIFSSNSDYFYFFALGPSDWANRYDPNKPDTSYFNHPYETRNYYYLTVSNSANPIQGPPLRIPVLPADADTSGSPVKPATFPERIHDEQSNEYFPDSPPVPDGTSNASGTVDSLLWQKWYWKSLDPGHGYLTTFDLPGVDAGQPVNLRMKLWGLTNYVRNSADLSLNGVAEPRATWPERPSLYSWKFSFTYEAALATPLEAGNAFQLSIPTLTTNTTSRVGLAWIDFFYSRQLEPVGDSLGFVAPAGTGRAVYRIGPFTSATPPRLFDITDARAPKQLNNFHYLALDADHWQLAFATDGVELKRFLTVPDGKIARLLGPSVLEAPPTSLLDLRKLEADYLVIYFDGFGAAAESLAAWRHTHLPLAQVQAPYDTATVPVSALYDQFSGGRTDPLAIRNFLRAVFLQQGTGRRVSFVTLLGDASYDYKNFLGKAQPGQPACLLPTYENGYDTQPLGGHQFTTDDWLFNVDDAQAIIPDFFGGRLPVGDPATALDVVRNKVLLYERQAPLGEYRNRVMLIADDNTQCDKPDGIGWGHLQQTATLDASHTPPQLDREYVYLHTYPKGLSSCTKPEAKAEIKRNLQEGTQIFNYIGHGSPFQLSDEAVFIQTDVGTLMNAPRYPLFVAASCDVGLFNDPTTTSIGEKLATTPGGGTIGVISSTQLAYSQPNATLNNLLFDRLFDRDPASGGQYHMAISEALLEAKEAASGGAITNDSKYQLLGDAGSRLNLPRLWVELALEDTLGNPVTQLPRGASLRFSGRVLDHPSGSPIALNGTASILIEDSAPIQQPPGVVSGYAFYYRAGPVYRADVGVANGSLEGRFVVPLEAREGDRGRIRAYVTGREPGGAVDTDGAGSAYASVAAGTAAPGDNEGPRIALSFPGGALEVRSDAVLDVDLYDPSGILITDHTPQNAIVVTLDGNSTSRVDITSSFRYAANSYQSGRATFALPDLSLGFHRVAVSAADNLASGFNSAAHRSSAGIEFRVVETPSLRVSRAYLFPDPTRSKGPGRGGQFVVDAVGDSVNVLLRIYTVSGKLVRTLKSFGGFQQIQVPWDGLDEDADPLANGVYLFKVNVNASEEGGKSSAREHAMAEGRFVVLNR